MILLYPPHTSLRNHKTQPKDVPVPLVNVHLLPLSIRLSAPSKETRPNHNIVKALLVFWFKSLFTLFAEYSSAVTASRQTVSPERGLPQPDLSCWAAAETFLSLSIKWNPGYWVGPWDPSIEVGYGPVLGPSSPRATLILPAHLYPLKPSSWEPLRCLCHLNCSPCQLGTSDSAIGSRSTSGTPAHLPPPEPPPKKRYSQLAPL